MDDITDELIAWLHREIEAERQHLISIGGTGPRVRNSQGTAMGLARNAVREDVCRKIEELLKH